MDRIVGAGVPQGGSQDHQVAVDKPAGDVDPSPFSASDLLRHSTPNAQAQAHPHPLTHGIPQLDVALVLGVPEPQWIESRRPVPS